MKTTKRIAAVLALLAAACASKKQPGFENADEAARQLVQALRENDVKRAEEILGPGSEDLLNSGDEVADRNGRQKFVELYDEKHRLEQDAPDRCTLCVGEIDWPLPMPIIRSGDVWVFDTAAGADELINRRIGRNELGTIQVCLAYCDAQREYFEADRNGDGVLEYAQKIKSSEGKQDGLFWPAAEGEPQSPLGDLAAQAVKEGYGGNDPDSGPHPYHGYFYRILTGQGSHAQGGAFSYVAGGHMIGGFALVAYPAEYGNSGVMSFIVDHDGAVFQKDLGDDTDKIAEAMKSFDPDPTWKAVGKETE
ncbi:MAG TPA: DUF2950 domain-containing protein [Planctomycetota bacterium]|nr:DUF2950 domain-containing protein [Planctomycetota bacterium]